MGNIAGMLKAAPPEVTPLQRELNRTGTLLGLIVVAIAVVMIATIVIIEDVRGLTALIDVLILGVAYRGDVRETAFTSARLLKKALSQREISVYADDPLFSSDELHAMGYTPLTPETEDQIDAIILQANHQAYQTLDFKRFPNCRVVLDGRQAFAREKIEALGIEYIEIGDGKLLEATKSHQDASNMPSLVQEEGVCD